MYNHTIQSYLQTSSPLRPLAIFPPSFLSFFSIHSRVFPIRPRGIRSLIHIHFIGNSHHALFSLLDFRTFCVQTPLLRKRATGLPLMYVKPDSTPKPTHEEGSNMREREKILSSPMSTLPNRWVTAMLIRPWSWWIWRHMPCNDFKASGAYVEYERCVTVFWLKESRVQPRKEVYT